jgi:nickel-dependent lactate racemase
MEIAVPFGEETILVSLPPETEVTVLSPAQEAGIPLKQGLRQGLSRPVGAEPLESFVRRSEDLLVLVNDLFRPTPTAAILTELEPQLQKSGRLRFLVATGLHPRPSPEDLRTIFGRLLDRHQTNVFSHDSDADGELTHLGRTSFGTEVDLHKFVQEASHLLTISSVEPHYFSGFTGGRKMFLPGVSSRRATQNNHALALSEKAQPLSLEGNPVHEDMEEALDLLKGKEIFSIQVVSTDPQRVRGCFCGDIRGAFSSAVVKAREVFAQMVGERYDVVVAVVGPPLDKNLYQIQKSMEHAKLVLKEEGIIILVSPCHQGIGNDEWLKLSRRFSSWQEILTYSGEWSLGFHKLYRTALIKRWARIWGVTGLDPEILRKVFIEPRESLEKALEEAFSVKGSACRTLVLMDAGHTVPILE